MNTKGSGTTMVDGPLSDNPFYDVYEMDGHVHSRLTGQGPVPLPFVEYLRSIEMVLR